jgi:hypothetical protein
MGLESVTAWFLPTKKKIQEKEYHGIIIEQPLNSIHPRKINLKNTKVQVQNWVIAWF